MRIDDIDQGGHNGLDGVYLKNGKYYIVEGKYSGSASIQRADPNTGLARQMSDAWIFSRPWEKVVNGGDALRDVIRSSNNFERLLAKVAPDGSVVYRKIDDRGFVIRGNAGNWP